MLRLVGRGLFAVQALLEELRAVLRRVRLVAHQHDGAFGVVFPDAFTGARTGHAPADDEVVATNHTGVKECIAPAVADRWRKLRRKGIRSPRTHPEHTARES